MTVDSATVAAFYLSISYGLKSISVYGFYFSLQFNSLFVVGNFQAARYLSGWRFNGLLDIKIVGLIDYL